MDYRLNAQLRLQEIDSELEELHVRLRSGGLSAMGLDITPTLVRMATDLRRERKALQDLLMSDGVSQEAPG